MRRTPQRAPSRNGWSRASSPTVGSRRSRRSGRSGWRALLEVLSRFEPGRSYTEPEVNRVLLAVHEDFAYLRRELVNYRYLERADGVYRVVAEGSRAGADRGAGDPGLGGRLAAGVPGSLADKTCPPVARWLFHQPRTTGGHHDPARSASTKQPPSPPSCVSRPTPSATPLSDSPRRRRAWPRRGATSASAESSSTFPTAGRRGSAGRRVSVASAAGS